jgi:hypothetical protein
MPGRYDSRRLRRLLGFASLAGIAILLLPTCRSTRHTVARIVTPPPVPTEVFIPAAPSTATSAPGGTTAPVAASPTPTPTIVPMRVVTAPAGSREERTPGILYEQRVPTVVAVTPSATPIATREATPRSRPPRRTPTPAATQKPGVYYEDEEGRPLPTATPRD